MVVKKIQMIAPGYTDILHPETDSSVVIMANGSTLENEVTGVSKIEVTTGTGTAILINPKAQVHLRVTTIYFSTSNGGAPTTINGKPFYKESTTITPIVTAWRSCTIWYDASGSGTFFLKASAEGTSVASDVLAGKTFSNDSGTGLVGTMIKRNSRISASSAKADGYASIMLAPPEGYYTPELDANGLGLLYAYDPNFIASNLLSGKTYFGLAGGIPVITPTLADSVSSSGNMVYGSWGDGKNYAIMNGISGKYFDVGTNWIRSEQPDLLASNIVIGKNIFGLAGTAVNGTGMKRVATGSFSATISGNGQEFTISGLAFRPSALTLKVGYNSVNYSEYAGVNQTVWGDAYYGISSGNFSTYGSGFVRTVTSNSITIKWAQDFCMGQTVTAYWTAIE